MALSCALCWASAVWLFRRAGPLDAKAMNIFKNIVSSALLLLTMWATGKSFDWQRSWQDWVALVVSAALGLSIGDTLFFMGLRRVGTSVAAVTDCTYAPTVMALSALFLGESLTGGLLLGAPLVVAGLVLVSWQGKGLPGKGVAKVDPLGVLYCVAGVVSTACAVVVAKPVLGRSDLIEATTVRLIAGTILLLIWDTAAGRLHIGLSLLRPQPAWRKVLPATLIGTYVSMLLWMGGFKYTEQASRAALLNQMGTVFALCFAALSGEVIPKLRWGGAALALAGAVTVLVARVWPLVLAAGLLLAVVPEARAAPAELPATATPEVPSMLVSAAKSDLGTTLKFSLRHAPFPAAGKPYSDPTVYVFAPRHLKAKAALDVLVHFHGHDGMAGAKLAEHQYREQLFESGKNLLLVMPQGPTNAPDSSAGKIEEADGLKRMLDELLGLLRQDTTGKKLLPAVIGPKAGLGRVALSAHSGGYRAVAFALDRGGVKVSEVYLYDALYGEAAKFRAWLQGGGRMVSWFTKGEPLRLNKQMAKQLDDDGVPHQWEGKEGTLRAGQFRAAQVVFVHTDVPHSKVGWQRNPLRDALATSGFAKAKGAEAAPFAKGKTPRGFVERAPVGP